MPFAATTSACLSSTSVAQPLSPRHTCSRSLNSWTTKPAPQCASCNMRRSVMTAQWVADRSRLRSLLDLRPDWSLQDFADAIGRSRSWVKKWRKRLRLSASTDPASLQGLSCARHTPPPRLSALVVERILAIRDNPPQGLNRIPGPKAILYYLQTEASTSLQGERLPHSTRTIWQILRQHQ